MTSSRWATLCAGVALLFAALLGFVFWMAPRDEDGIRWTDQFVAGGWMAWTLPVALFFIAIAALLALMTLLALRYPETPRPASCGSRRRAATGSSSRCSARPSSASPGSTSSEQTAPRSGGR